LVIGSPPACCVFATNYMKRMLNRRRFADVLPQTASGRPETG
jgi:hypothetical protein